MTGDPREQEVTRLLARALELIREGRGIEAVPLLMRVQALVGENSH